MNPSIPLSLLAFSMTAALGFCGGDDNDSAPGENTSRSKPSPLSPRIAAAIRATLPNYEPPPPSVGREAGAEDMTDVVVLSPIFVNEKPPPAGNEWDLLSDAGRAAYLKEHYRGAAVPGNPMTTMTPNYGMQMLADDMRLKRLKEIDDIVDTLRVTGYPKDWKELKKDLLVARMRPNDWKAESLDRSYNNDRP